MIPDCYDPIRHEEARQAAWDRLAENFPRCGCCGESVYPGDYYHEHLNLILCHRCFNRMEDNEYLLEVS